MHKKAHTLALTLVLTSALALTGCASSPTPTSRPSDLPTSTPTSTSTAGNESLYTVGTEMGSKPSVEVDPSAGNVDNLIVKDIVEGTGPAVQLTDQITVHYVGIGGISHQQFEASWDRGEPIRFPLRGLIKAWQDGIPGMAVGGRRQLVCPPETAYGPVGGGHRLSGRTLVFVIDLLEA